MTKIINYTNRDFESIKRFCIEYAKQYYPNVYKDFSEASFGALMIDLISFIGDNLSFYIDYQANEQFLATAQQYDNVERLARERGYRDTGQFALQGEVNLYVVVPADSNNKPNSNYFPILKKNSTFSVKGTNAIYLLTEDVDFNLNTNRIAVAAVGADGLPTSFALRAKGKVVSGDLYVQRVNVGSLQQFLKIRIENPLMTEIISIKDSSGNEYYQVDYLSQNCVFKYIKNIEIGNNQSQYKLTKIYAPRRFVIEKIDGFYNIVFGGGTIDAVRDPRDVVLNFNSRNFVTERQIDPKNIIESDKFGVAPIDTTLTIIYRANNTKNMAASSGGISKVVGAQFKFDAGNLSESTKASVVGSLEVENPEPISAVNPSLSVDELRVRAFDSFSSQYRAVTNEDYVYLCYSMDPKYGAIKRAAIFQDSNSFKRNLNLYVIGEDDQNHLTSCNNVIKENLKKWIQNYKMINDTIDILDAKIINFGIEFKVDTKSNNKEIVLIRCINRLKERFATKMNIGEPIPIYEIFQLLNTTEDVIDTKKVKITILNESGYASSNFDVYANLSADGSYVLCPDDCIFELKFFETDIKGTIF